MITHNDLNRSDVDFALEMIEKTVSRNAEFDSCEGLNHHIHREIVSNPKICDYIKYYFLLTNLLFLIIIQTFDKRCDTHIQQLL